jgi:hypothetical protein
MGDFGALMDLGRTFILPSASSSRGLSDKLRHLLLRKGKGQGFPKHLAGIKDPAFSQQSADLAFPLATFNLVEDC